MTKSEKREKRKQRSIKRFKKRKEERKEIIKVCEIDEVPFRIASYYVRHGDRIPWHDEEGKLIQKCSWKGTCEYPCNGDC